MSEQRKDPPLPSPSGVPLSGAVRPATLADLHAVLHVCQSHEIADAGTFFTTAEQLAAEWAGLGPQLAAQVWVAETADGSLVACAQLVRTAQVFMPRLWLLSDFCGCGFELALLSRAEQQASETAREQGDPHVQLFAQAAGSNPEAQRALGQAGFELTSTFEKMECRLEEPPAVPPVIAGLDIRPFVVGRDEAAVYHADEEAFLDERGHTPRTVEQWSRRLGRHAEHFDPSVWLVAWDGDEVAGAALGEVVMPDGWIHHLGVRRPWRRRGVGAALTLAALGTFYRLGIQTVHLNVDAESLTNAHRLYRRLGFQVVGTYCNYRKKVSQPA